MNRRPDGAARLARGVAARRTAGLAEFGHLFDGYLDAQRESLLFARVDDGDRTVSRSRGCGVSWRFHSETAPLRDLGTAQESRHLLQRPLRCRQSDALRRPLADAGKPLEREREVRAALVRHQGVNLINDDGVDAAKHLAHIRREHQIDRLGRGDQNVGGLAEESSAFRGRRVAGANGDRRRRERVAALGGQTGDPGKRHAQVALHVDGQRFERRDVHHATSAFFRRRRREHQPVQAP